MKYFYFIHLLLLYHITSVSAIQKTKAPAFKRKQKRPQTKPPFITYNRNSISTAFPKDFSSSYKPPPVSKPSAGYSPSPPTQRPQVSPGYGSPTPAQPALSGGYGGGGGGLKGGVKGGDEKQQLCVDVSSYEPVVWVEQDGEECRTDFVQQCEERSEKVCDDVTETICEVVPYTECRLSVTEQNIKETRLTPQTFTERRCSKSQRKIPHQKLLPECKNVTKSNCVLTNWETDKYGNQVWTGNEACDPVSWQECKLVPKEVNLVVPVIDCAGTQQLYYYEPKPSTVTRLANTFTCSVKKTTSCRTVIRPDCKQITWNECSEVPIPKCSFQKIFIPTQKFKHRKKCLFTNSKKNSRPSYEKAVFRDVEVDELEFDYELDNV